MRLIKKKLQYEYHSLTFFFPLNTKFVVSKYIEVPNSTHLCKLECPTRFHIWKIVAYAFHGRGKHISTC